MLYEVITLLLESEPALRQRQLELLDNEAIEVVRLAEVPVPAGLRLALLELAMPALKQMSAPQYRGFRDQLVRLMQADRRISLTEWILYRVLQHQLGSQYVRRVETPARYRQLEQVADAVQTLLSCLAHLSAPEQAERVFGKGANSMALYGIRLQANPPVAALGPALGALEQATPPCPVPARSAAARRSATTAPRYTAWRRRTWDHRARPSCPDHRPRDSGN